MIRAFSYFLILMGCVFLADAAFEQHSGVADAVAPRGARRYIIARDKDPAQFRSLMAYQWFRGSMTLMAGLIILGICRRADRLDPLSPDFAGSDALDELDKAVTEVENLKLPKE